MFQKLFLFFFIFALCHLADPIKLTNDNGAGKFTPLHSFSAIDQCYGSMGEYASISYRIQFRVVGKGHCQLYLCYQSQLDPNSVIDGMAPEYGYNLLNVKSNKLIVEKCMNGMENSDKIEGQLHGIFIDVDLEHITMSMSFYGKNFSIETNNFMLEMAKASHSFITTKMLIFDEKTQKFVSVKTDEYAKDEQIRRQFFQLQHQGAQLADFPGLWAIALDMLPSDFNQKQELKIFTLGSKDTKHLENLDHKICDINSGKWAEDDCHIEAYFLGPNDEDDKYPGEAVTGLKTIELPYNEILKNAPLKLGDKIYITGRIGEPKIGTFKIHLLHNWTEPDSIMGETILSIMVRPNRINFASHYNFTVNIKHNDPIDKHIGQRLDQDIDHKFSMVIATHGDGNYSLVLNCLDGNKTFFFVQNEALFPLGYTLTDYILIETEGNWAKPEDNPWELHHFKINKSEPTLTEPNPPNTLTTISADPSYSLELDLANLDNDIFIIVKLELPENAIKFDINLVRHDGKRNDGIILAHFHANLIGGYYEWTNTKTIDASNGAYKQLEAGKKFELLFAQINKATDLIFIDGILLNQWPTVNKPNYIQFKGNVIRSNLTIHHNHFLIAQEYPLESAFKPFNEITILVKLEPSYNKFKIIFKCRNEGKCGKALSNNFLELLYSDETAMLIYNDESFSRKIQLPLNEVIEVRIYANQFEYQISIMSEYNFTANYLQFPTPDKIDTIQIDGLFCHVQEKERAQKYWKQIDSDISLKFIYKLDKTLEIGSTIKAKIRIGEKMGNKMFLYLLHDATMFEEHFGATVFYLHIEFIELPDVAMIKYGIKISENEDGIIGYDVITRKPKGDKWILELEIVVQHEYYQILIDGEVEEKLKIKHILPVWMVDFVRIEGGEKTNNTNENNKLLEAKITWPSDSSTKWLEPSNEISLRPANSIKVDLASAKKINMKIQMMENYKLIKVFLMTSCQEWNESEIYKKVCVAPFIFKFEFNLSEITEDYNGQLRVEKGKFDVGKTSFYLDFNLHDMKNTNSWDIKNSFHKGAVGKINYKMENINYIQVTGDLHSFQTKIELAKNLGMPRGVPLFIKLARPLRINDVILIKGKLLSALNVKRRLAILLQRNIPDDEFPFQILDVLIVYNSSAVNEKNGNNTKLSLYRDTFDTNGTAKLHNISESEFFDSMQQVDVSIRVQKKQFEVEHKGKSNVTLNADHDGWFWAVQYIKFFFLPNSGDSEDSSPTIAMDKGYPKIMHQYP